MASVNANLTQMVRLLINDFDPTSERYTDDQINQMICLAGIYVGQDYYLPNDYTIDVENRDISPDPVVQEDDAFIALATLKSGCLFNLNQYQLAVRTGIKVRSGEDSVDLTSGFRGYKDIIENGPCESYEKLLKQLRSVGSGKSGQTVVKGRAVADLATHPQSGYYGTGHVRFFDSFIGRNNY